MIKVTAEAAKQIKASAQQGGMPGFALRIAVKKNTAGGFEYAMGFDDNITQEDTAIESEGVQLLVSSMSEIYLKGATLDFVKLDEEDEFEFVFLNPNDPTFQVNDK